MSDKSTFGNAKETTEAGKIAGFYGFKPTIPPEIKKADFECSKNFNQKLHPAEKVALIRTYFEEKLMALPQPNLLYCERPFHGITKEKKKPSKTESSLICLGSSKSVCECLSIQTALAILNAVGYKNLLVEINTIGDKDSVSEFHRKLLMFVRKNFASFSSELRQAAKKDPFAIFEANEEEWKNLEAECPKPIDFLSESSRLHFKEALEFLEAMGIVYRINHRLVGDPEFGSETIFSIKTEDGSEELAEGFRFNRLAKKMGCKKEVPCSVLNISAKLKKEMKKTKIRPAKPDFYLVQFGPEAKLKSFLILEAIRKAGRSVVHSIAKDKLGSQIGVAENSEAPYIILIGQKEALENSVVIRDSSTRSQETVLISDLSTKIKELV